MAVAVRVAAAYAGNPDVAALAVAGSVGAGLADRFSDLELDCYWGRPPSAADRLHPVTAAGGSLLDLWDYDEDDEEWSEDYRVGELDITVSNFLVESAERFIDDVIVRASTDPVRHMRLAAIQRSHPLIGADLMASWRARAAAFPDELVSALVEQALSPDALRGWAARQALASRGDHLALSGLLARVGHAVFRAVLAVNRVYLPHQQLKGQRHLLSELTLTPDRFAERLRDLSARQPATSIRAAETLLADTAALVTAHTGADIADFRAELSERRAGDRPAWPARAGTGRAGYRAALGAGDPHRRPGPAGPDQADQAGPDPVLDDGRRRRRGRGRLGRGRHAPRDLRGTRRGGGPGVAGVPGQRADSARSAGTALLRGPARPP